MHQSLDPGVFFDPPEDSLLPYIRAPGSIPSGAASLLFGFGGGGALKGGGLM